MAGEPLPPDKTNPPGQTEVDPGSEIYADLFAFIQIVAAIHQETPRVDLEPEVDTETVSG